MFSYLTIIFPLAVALFVLLWFCRWVNIRRRAPLGAKQQEEPAAAIEDKRFSRRDWLLLGALTAIYALVAFIGLGSTKAPQTFLHYESGNTYALIELARPQAVTGLRYYSGLHTADYSLEFSADMENWVPQVKEDGTSGMTQTYTQVFRWNDATLNADNDPVRYIRIVSGAEQYLGEVAIYGEDGQLLAADELIPASGCEMLLDEQDVIPEEYSFQNGTYFDEIYFPRTALEMIQNIWPYEITHPPMGKAILSLGIRLFGMTPFGWRFMGTLFGVLMLPLFYLFLKRMFGYTAVAACGSTVFAFDFMHFTQTRLATIDSYAVFFTILMYLFMYMWLTEPPERERRRLLWLGLSGLSFGFGAASKWVCIYAGGGLGLIWLVHWVCRLVKAKKISRAAFARAKDALILNIGWCLLFFVVLPCLVYYVSYWTYAPSQGIDGPWRLFSKRYLQLVIDNQKYMWDYHSDLVAEHPYSSVWYQWIFDIRPILYYLAYPASGVSSRFGTFSNPMVAWGGLLAVGGMGWLAVRERDERAIFILIGYLANLLPWVLVSRLTFAYHYFPCTVFLVLAISYIFADLRRRDIRWKRSLRSFTCVSVALFAIFYPVLSGVPYANWYGQAFLRWFADTWPF